MKKNIQVFDVKTGCRKVLFSILLKMKKSTYYIIFSFLLQIVAGSNYLGAGYEVRLRISLLGDLEPLKSYLRRFRFFIY